MTKFNLFILIFFLVFALIHGQDEWTGLKVMQEQESRHKAKTEITKEIMILTDKNGAKEERTFRKYIKEDFKPDSTGLLIVFDTPNSIFGTALLTWDNEKRENDQWMYLPARGELQRIAAGSRKGYFMGTDFTYEDMEPEDIDEYTYKILSTDTISKMECWKIEALPINDEIAKNSGYSKRILYVLKDLFITVKIEFYDKRNTHIKTLLVGKLKKLDTKRYRADRSIMINHKTEHRTELNVTQRQIDTEINSDYFHERFITTKRHMQQ
jgi:hypothetical protein